MLYNVRSLLEHCNFKKNIYITYLFGDTNQIEACLFNTSLRLLFIVHLIITLNKLNIFRTTLKIYWSKKNLLKLNIFLNIISETWLNYWNKRARKRGISLTKLKLPRTTNKNRIQLLTQNFQRWKRLLIGRAGLWSAWRLHGKHLASQLCSPACTEDNLFAKK